ncbi:DmsC/YnfH family molybdoenzyme membrane anchor subunit [Ramlibacter sp.]|uniref:DmsC/YnfH family molybdoenzyme membrane anchor subunit n=1 Tax=Ramlibacter sp. TaxID=1917967 RepID=UPI002BDEB89E|nr:DmsC/YnfH family molybdoenzyme membrane anchor subunit [Ramlibacter sp.]HWI84468.1 DmsC/YnfH family molybdoenzyme membrane anchor subunit [Ramlibacter sp.]
MTYGPAPWQQAHWDWRAAGNFIFGGAGAGLLAATALSGVGGLAATLLTLAGMALVGLGLLCVWLEIGRPWRAMNVMRRPGSSWMSRESMVAPLLFALGLGVAAGLRAWAPLLLFAALGFVYCQGRIVQAAKGIPAWREPLTVPLFVATGLAEGAGLFWLAGVAPARGGPALALYFAALLAARWLLWRAWRRRIAPVAAVYALQAIDPAGRALQWLGTALPLGLALLAATGIGGAAILLAGAGLLAAATGAFFKFTLITRAAFNQGFALPHLPVRGVPR